MISFHQEKDRFNYRVAAILIHQQKVLLHRFIDWETWLLPGGRCEWFEPSTKTVIREMEEELGIEVKINRLCYIVENFFLDKGTNFHELCFYYLVQPVNWNPILDQTRFTIEENDSKFLFEWIPLDELKDAPLYPAFLRTSIHHLPKQVEHRIEYEEDR
ncbi:ADP-ribose pyrophosphatase YjhB, NUDIX family [Seinonella peptonophila]|uniref:ADP-ribose pyrophosphatase YjhB, NUDIX family n=1 Tax=Seinonella peptonophila TaxID=112248 RepID=A0A1M4TPA7_9BACL|nr:NUDIX hydrolase [Seinonella peptonophila]SHE46273.1 ADP-ribose pyrophosphatase YjhB, NUDIX family [Seinonella peptonophila]